MSLSLMKAPPADGEWKVIVDGMVYVALWPSSTRSPARQLSFARVAA